MGLLYNFAMTPDSRFPVSHWYSSYTLQNTDALLSVLQLHDCHDGWRWRLQLKLVASKCSDCGRNRAIVIVCPISGNN